MESKLLMYVLLIFSGAIMTISFLTEPTITGHAFVNTYVKDINVTLDKNSSYTLDFDELTSLNGVSLSGMIIGKGKVKVYIENGINKHLVYTNMPSEKGLSHITGFMVKDESSNFKLNKDVSALIDEKKKRELFDSVIDDRIIQEFSNTCSDSCILENFKEKNFKLIFELSGNILLKINKISYRLS